MTTSATAAVIVLLTLTNAANFRHRSLKNAAGLTAHIKQGETIKVSEEMATYLTGETFVAPAQDEEADDLPFFVVAEEGTKVDHDFVSEPEALGTRATSHDLASLPESHLITDAVAPGGTLARAPAGRTQRTARARG